MLKTLKISISIFLAGATLAACSSTGGGGNSISPDQDSVTKATDMRTLYDKTNGDYTKLSDAEKAQFKKDIAPGLDPEKAFANLAPQKPTNTKVQSQAAGDPRPQGG